MADENSLSQEDENKDCINPCPPEWLDSDADLLLRGDAIGDTAYTHRWVLQCLFTIIKGLPRFLVDIEDNSSKEKLLHEVEATTKKPDQSNEDVDEADESNSEVIDIMSEDGGTDMNCTPVKELDSEIEDAACQLWDMTVEEAVTHHLLELEEADILELVSLIVEKSCAPRLTEVMVGVLANMCCQEKGCEKMLEEKKPNELLLSLIHLLGNSSDVPTICEVLRLFRLLLWHRINRTPKSALASCPLLKLLCQNYGQSVIAFLLHNSLSDTLLGNLLELLSSFLLISLPETGLTVASLFSDSVQGLLDILMRKASQLDSNISEEQLKIIHSTITCLCSFIDTTGAQLIIDEAKKPDSKLQVIILQTLEMEGGVESLEELTEDLAERLCYVLSLCQLLIPYVKIPSCLWTVGRLLALINGQTHQYSVSRSSSREDRTSISSDVEEGNFLQNIENYLISHSRRKSGEDKGTQSQQNLKDRSHCTLDETPEDSDMAGMKFSNPPVHECGWLSPAVASVTEYTALSSGQQSSTSVNKSNDKCTDISVPGNSNNHRSKSNDSSNSENGVQMSDDDHSAASDLAELKETLEEYCYQLLAWWWSAPTDATKCAVQNNILDVLDQCHAHEVLFILKSVRSRDPTLVPKLQEQVLDSKSHRRLVALLAYMYQ